MLSGTGVRIALDEFGAESSSLACLRRLPIDHLKIDRSFLVGGASGRVDDLILATMLDHGRSLGVEVTATGVELREQCERLVGLGYELGQGVYVVGLRPADATLQTLLRAPLGGGP